MSVKINNRSIRSHFFNTEASMLVISHYERFFCLSNCACKLRVYVCLIKYVSVHIFIKMFTYDKIIYHYLNILFKASVIKVYYNTKRDMKANKKDEVYLGDNVKYQ